MSVLKKYNEGTSQWEAVVLGKQGPSGTVAVTAPLTNSGTSTAATLGLDYSALQYGQNYIINGGFDIWQRGTSFSTSGTYSADRWYQTVDNPSAGTISQVTTSLPTGFRYGIKMQRNASNAGTGYVSIAQALETANTIPLAGKTVTLSFWAKAGANFSAASGAFWYRLYSGTGTDQAAASFGGWSGYSEYGSGTVYPTTSWQQFTVTVTLQSGISQLGLRFLYVPQGTAGADDSVSITGVKLEVGPQATPFSRAGGDIQGELAKCQRYYYRLTADANNVYPLWAMGSATNTSQAQFNIPLKQTMRTYPLSLDYATLGVTHDNAAQYAASSISLVGNNLNNNSAQIAVNTSGLTAYRPYFLFGTNSASNYIGFSAEL